MPNNYTFSNRQSNTTKPAQQVVDENMLIMTKKKNAFSAIYNSFRDYIRNTDCEFYIHFI